MAPEGAPSVHLCPQSVPTLDINRRQPKSTPINPKPTQANPNSSAGAFIWQSYNSWAIEKVPVGHMTQLGHIHSKRIRMLVAVGHATQLSHIHSKRISA